MLKHNVCVFMCVCVCVKCVCVSVSVFLCVDTFLPYADRNIHRRARTSLQLGVSDCGGKGVAIKKSLLDQ